MVKGSDPVERGASASEHRTPTVRGRTAGPHTAARTAVVWQVLRRELERAEATQPRLTVVDVGGGTGGFAVPLAQAGHDVTVVDASPDALAALTRRAAEAGVPDRVHAVQGDADSLAGLIAPGTADLVLCHNVLEVVDSPAEAAAALAATLRRGGAASVLVANRAAAVLVRAMGGHLDVAAALLDDPDGRAGERDTLRRRFDIESATALLGKVGLPVEEVHGVRVVADLVPGAVLEREHGALAEFELATASRSPYRDVASQLHLLARRP
jgi:S-adenosylmethionine-dependent methyltransferase